MIRINLLPGAQKKATGPAISLDALGALKDKISDPWMIGATGAVIVSVATVGLLFSSQQARASELETRLDRARNDSSRYAAVVEARRKIIAERDSVERQLAIIRSIDDARYQWAHILDEVSRALPSYTWLTVIEQTSKPPAAPARDTSTAEVKPAGRPAAKPKRDTILPAPTLAAEFRVVGQTVDIQALTLYMRQLEASPFIQSVTLKRSEIVVVDGKDVTEFELTAAFEQPAPGATRTVPLVVPVR